MTFSRAAQFIFLAALAYFYAANPLLDFNPGQLQQTGQQNQILAQALLIENSLKQHATLPLWDPYRLTGLPVTGDPFSSLWNPLATLPVIIFGAVNGLKVSAFLALLAAGLGQWLFASVFRVRGVFRLWAGALFMVSGGLVLLWWLGSSQLLIAIACLPWCLAAVWWALERRDRLSIVLAVLGVGLVLSAETAYSLYYLPVCLAVLVLTKSRASTERRRLALRSGAILGLSAGLLGVVWLPLVAAQSYLAVQPGSDPTQAFSQPIPYALANYVVSKSDWFTSDILGAAVKANWHYLGWLPLLALFLVPAAIIHARRNRPALIALSAIVLILLAWEANRFTPIKFIYDLFPSLFNLRLPGLLLVVAASPLIVLAALSLQTVYMALQHFWASQVFSFSLLKNKGVKTLARLRLKTLMHTLLLLGLALTLWDVYTVNQTFAFVPATPASETDYVLNWLHNHDPSLYYVSLGGGLTFYDWLPAAYRASLPAINMDTGLSLAAQQRMNSPTSPFFARPKYLVTLPDVLIKQNVELVHDFVNFQVWRQTDAFPFAFSASGDLIAAGRNLTLADVQSLPAQFDGPNRISVQAASSQPGQRLVVLVNDFPGWQVSVDGQPTSLAKANYYLGVDLQPGLHTYTFTFLPIAFILGSLLSVATLLILVWLLVSHFRAARRRIQSGASPQILHP